MYLSMMSEVMDEKPWLEEDEYSKKNTEIVTKILDMFDRNVTLGDKRRIAKYREVLQSRIKEKGFSIEIRNWKRRYTYQGKEFDKKLAEIKSESSALKKKQQEDQQTIKSLEDQVQQYKSDIQELQSNVKYGEKEKTGQIKTEEKNSCLPPNKQKKPMLCGSWIKRKFSIKVTVM